MGNTRLTKGHLDLLDKHEIDAEHHTSWVNALVTREIGY